MARLIKSGEPTLDDIQEAEEALRNLSGKDRSIDRTTCWNSNRCSMRSAKSSAIDATLKTGPFAIVHTRP